VDLNHHLFCAKFIKRSRAAIHIREPLKDFLYGYIIALKAVYVKRFLIEKSVFLEVIILINSDCYL
jgi:hypothetical protein